MPIETVTTFRTSDGTIHHTIEKAEAWEENLPLANLLKPWIREENSRQDAAAAIRDSVKQQADQEAESRRLALSNCQTRDSKDLVDACRILKAIVDQYDANTHHVTDELEAAIESARRFLEPPF